VTLRVVSTADRRWKVIERPVDEQTGLGTAVAAGFAAAEMLRRQHFQGAIVMLSDDDAPPVDRPNLSKDYLAGNAPEEWIPLRSPDFYREHGIELKLGARAVAIDPKTREVQLADGARQRFFTHYGFAHDFDPRHVFEQHP
jgi:hypothetical protein